MELSQKEYCNLISRVAESVFLRILKEENQWTLQEMPEEVAREKATAAIHLGLVFAEEMDTFQTHMLPVIQEKTG